MRRRQGELGFLPDGQVSNFNYDADLSRLGLCNVIATHDLPLGFGSYPAVVDWIKTCHNPQYQPVSRERSYQTLSYIFLL